MEAKQTIKIGTRDSELALWQAKKVQTLLEKQGYKTELKPVKSQGDLNLKQPLYEMGITGIFTKTLDIALINGDIDIAVHSMKDVPTALPKGVVKAAVLPRANHKDILVHKDLVFLKQAEGTIATGSLRRKAQWLNRHPKHHVENLRGNVITRLQKLKDSDWNAAIFAAAGLERIELTPENHTELDWMISAPAQGAIMTVCMDINKHSFDALQALNHKETDLAVTIERDFLRRLEGGCTAPIGAFAEIRAQKLHFQGALFSLDGKQKYDISKTVDVANAENLGIEAADELLENDAAKKLMKELREVL
ncbi:MAG: hydroxymethylbilane synthase [Flavobacteriaceae bacterium]